jgi:hypothetical protein
MTERNHKTHTCRFSQDVGGQHSIASRDDLVAETVVSNNSVTQNRPARVQS